MYKVFVNEKPLYLTNKRPLVQENVYDIEEINLKNVLDGFFQKNSSGAFLFDPKGDVLNTFAKDVPIVLAAGGVVKNAKNKVLFIKRNKKWDLPKGKLDKGETIEAAAIREVEEETGISGLELGNFLQITYHVFSRKGKYKLKVVYWYKMHSSFDGKLVPQQEEGITKVKWKGGQKGKKALKNTYENIKLLFEENSIYETL